MRIFELHRSVDVSGVSGTGKVAEGVIFRDGTVVIHWLSTHPSTNVYESIETLLEIHGHGGATTVVYVS